MRKLSFLKMTSVCLLAASCWAGSALADDSSVSKKDYLELKRQVEQLKRDMATQQGGGSRPTSSDKSTLDALKQDVSDLKTQLEDGKLGTTTFVASGNLSAGLIIPEHDSSSFSTTFSPILLWKLSDDVFVESEIEFELEDSDTVTKLEFAQIDYTPFDSLTVVAGKFLSPINTYVERYESKWINKFPDAPLAVYDGLLPETHLGAEVRGGVPVGAMKANYSAFIGNGARLNTDEESAGTLNFDNFNDTNDDKSFGGRIGFFPLSNIEVGYGFEVGDASDPEGVVSDLSYVLHSVDFDMNVDSAAIAGRFGLRGQYAWSSVDDALYDEDGSLGFGPLEYANDRDGGYVQISYRPTRLSEKFITNLEVLARYDRANNPSGAIDPTDENRTTLGLDYWLDSGTVFKIAYEIDNKSGGDNNNAFLTQVATGF